MYAPTHLKQIDVLHDKMYMDVAPKLQWHNKDLRLTYILGFWAKVGPKRGFQVFSKSGGMEFFYFLFEVAVNN